MKCDGPLLQATVDGSVCSMCGHVIDATNQMKESIGSKDLFVKGLKDIESEDVEGVKICMVSLLNFIESGSIPCYYMYRYM